jgi:hypothetical protein
VAGNYPIVSINAFKSEMKRNMNRVLSAAGCSGIRNLYVFF